MSEKVSAQTLRRKARSAAPDPDLAREVPRGASPAGGNGLAARVMLKAEPDAPAPDARATDPDAPAMTDPTAAAALEDSLVGDVGGDAGGEEEAPPPSAAPMVGARAEAAVADAAQRTGDPLPAPLARDLSRALGADLRGVRTHASTEAADAAHALGARAYTLGQDMYFARGAYDPRTTEGQHLIAHEAAHTVQAPMPTTGPERGLEVSTPHDPLEVDADRFADAFVAGKAHTPAARAAAGGPVLRYPDVVPDELVKDKARFINPRNEGEGKVWEPGHGYIKNPSATSLSSVLNNGKIAGGFENGKFMYVVDGNGQVWIGKRMGKGMPHPTLIGGHNPVVQAAGMVEIRGGKIVRIDNHSGHYRPPRAALSAAVKGFTRLPKSAFNNVSVESFHLVGGAEKWRPFKSLRLINLKRLDIRPVLRRWRARFKHDPKFRGRLKGAGKAGLAILAVLIADYFIGQWLAEQEAKQIRKDIEKLQPAVEAALTASLEAQADAFDQLYERDPTAQIHMNITYRLEYYRSPDEDGGFDESYWDAKLVKAELSMTPGPSTTQFGGVESLGCCQVSSIVYHHFHVTQPLELSDLYADDNEPEPRP